MDSCSSPIVFPRGVLAWTATASGLCSGSRHRLVEAGVEPHPELVEGVGGGGSDASTVVADVDIVGDTPEVAGGAAASAVTCGSL